MRNGEGARRIERHATVAEGLCGGIGRRHRGLQSIAIERSVSEKRLAAQCGEEAVACQDDQDGHGEVAGGGVPGELISRQGSGEEYPLDE